MRTAIVTLEAIEIRREHLWDHLKHELESTKQLRPIFASSFHSFKQNVLCHVWRRPLHREPRSGSTSLPPKPGSARIRDIELTWCIMSLVAETTMMSSTPRRVYGRRPAIQGLNEEALFHAVFAGFLPGLGQVFVDAPSVRAVPGLDFGTHFDSVHVLSRVVPTRLPLDIFLVPDFDWTLREANHFTVTVNGERMELNCVPNFRLAEFGFSNRFKVNVFFPHLRASNGKFGHRMSLTEVGVFVDRVFLAALKVVAPSYVVNNFGVRYAAEVERYRNDQGQVRPKATSLVPFYVAPLQQTMRELVDGTPDLSGYRDFFFDCRAIGIKGYGPVDAYQEFLGDIAWDLVDPSNVYVDYGIEVCSQGGEKVVGLLAKEGHHDLARLIFGQSYTSNNSIYRLDEFGNTGSLAGFASFTTTPAPISPFGVTYMWAYDKAKVPFYNFPAKRDRGGLNVTLMHFFNSAYGRFHNFISKTCQGIDGEHYGVRFEVRLSLSNLLDHHLTIADIIRACAIGANRIA